MPPELVSLLTSANGFVGAFVGFALLLLSMIAYKLGKQTQLIDELKEVEEQRRKILAEIAKVKDHGNKKIKELVSKTEKAITSEELNAIYLDLISGSMRSKH